MGFSEWKTYKLNDALEALIDYRGKTPKKTTFGVPLVTAKIVKNGFIEKPNEFIAEEDYDSWMVRGFPKVGDVVLTTEAPIGEVAQIKDARIALAQRIVTLRGKKGLLDNSYLKYFLLSKIGQHRLKERETGTTVSGIKQSELRLVEIDCPPYETQIIIGNILSSLDDAIELNQQINKTLEEMAKAIFKEWFVDFNFPNATGKFQETEIGKIPVGWKSMKLNEALEIKYGKDHKHLQDGEFPVYGSGGIMRYAEKPLYESESILIPRKGTLSNLFYINKPFWTVDTMFYSKIKIKNSGKYLFHLLLTLNLASMNVGSAVPSLTTEVLNNIQIAMPDQNTLKEFEKIVSSLFKQAEQNIEENQTLMNLRDTLLPKLMKGEININL